MRVPILAILVLSACSGGALRSPRALRPAPPSNPAVELAALLPDGADRCVVIRPRQVAARRRALVLYRSWGRPEAWARDWELVAYAEATTRQPRARRSYLRFAARTEALEERVARLPVRWLEEACEGAACRRPVARWVDERTLEIAAHRWPDNRSAGIPSAACVQLATTHPRALELAADREGDPIRGGLSPRWVTGPQPHRIHRLMFADGAQLTARRVLTFRDEPEAMAWESLRRTTPEVSLMPLDPSSSSVHRAGNRITVEQVHHWEELELQREDERLERRAHAHRRARAEPIAVEQVDIDNLAVVRHQVRLRHGEVSRAQGDARRRSAERLAQLLERAIVAHPNHPELAVQLVRLELEVLERPANAVRIVEAVLGLRPVDPERWQLMRRESLARIDPAALASALGEDGVVPPRLAPAVAEDLAALARSGVRYEWAEGAWARGFAMVQSGVSASRPGELNLVGAVGAIVLWARARGTSAPSVHVAVRWDGETAARAIGRSQPELLLMRAGADRTLAVGAVSVGDLASLRGLGASLASVVPPGPLELVIELASPGGHSARFSVTGVREGDVLRISRVGASLREVGWDALQRYLAEPIEELSPALFPPPELTVRAASREDATRLLRAAEGAAPGTCRIAGPYLRCLAPGRPERLTEILVALMR